MRSIFAITLLFLLSYLSATAQQTSLANRQVGAELIPPVLLPSAASIPVPRHCDELDGVVKFAATIGTDGSPHTLKLLDTSDQRLVLFATELGGAQRFKPAVINGSSTAVPVQMSIGLHTCAQREKHPVDGNLYQFTLRAHPLVAVAVVNPPAEQETASVASAEVVPSETLGKRVCSPTPLTIADPKVPVSGKLPIRGHSYLSVTIDTDGMPQNIHVVRGLEPELDSNAIEAIRNWRFKPALRDGSTPVAYEGTIVATFEYVDKEPVAFNYFVSATPENVLAAMAQNKEQHFEVEPVNADEVVALYMPPSRVTGRVLVSLLIDSRGVPQNVHVVKGLDSSLGMDTVAMVEHLRFKPQMTDEGTSAEVAIVIPVRYRMTVGRRTWKDVLSDGLTLAAFLFL